MKKVNSEHNIKVQQLNGLIEEKIKELVNTNKFKDDLE